MSPARWCCLGLIALGVLLTLVDLTSYYAGVRAMAQIAGVSCAKLILRQWILGRPGLWFLGLGAHVGPVGQWGLGCAVIGLTGLVFLELLAKPTRKTEP